MDFLVAPPYLDETAGTLRPDAVIPIDWDNFFLPLRPFEFLPRIADHSPSSLQGLIDCTEQQSTQAILLNSNTSYPFAPMLQPAS